ncbi:2-oxoacid:acceptor oxidoreductase family protein [Candidatus Oleimmundimicrobium sp.]|uniref:2-oxoacid:acceptor oxidoreductase family protein n=1 Tax=Candidatus Oleimmundimicrobium sp. TaxID=3060597 RepID=UPI002718D169|nr:2-oxoacid:acceptor oxidoreductase family protein [Candidatus Oleimmundimicrobium sp.]MDO8886235.1 2-oxoacid:acceptor oxidoreductase family protein [Candidatus Oleimmundimicrobium sp.]
MEKCTEIRWHARGGQGAVTAAKFLAEVALASGKNIQAFPEYGPERMGAPIQAFTRIASSPITLYCSVENPGIVVVLDETLLDVVKVTKGLLDDGIILVNTNNNPAEVRKKLGIKSGKIYTVNATAIAVDTLGKPIPNTPMIGALIKVTDMVPLEVITRHFAESFSKKFNQKILEGNIEAIKQAYEKVRGE